MTPTPNREIVAKLADTPDLITIYLADLYSGNMVPNNEIVKVLAPFLPLIFTYSEGIRTYTKPAIRHPSSPIPITTTATSSGRPKDPRFTCTFVQCPRHTNPLSDNRRCKEHIQSCKFNPEVIEKNAEANRIKTEASKCKYCGNFYGTPTTCQNHMRICSKNPEGNLAVKSTCKFCKKILWDLNESVMIKHLRLCESNPDSECESYKARIKKREERIYHRLKEAADRELALHSREIDTRIRELKAKDADKAYEKVVFAHKDDHDGLTVSQQEAYALELELAEIEHAKHTTCMHCNVLNGPYAMDRFLHEENQCRDNPEVDVRRKKNDVLTEEARERLSHHHKIEMSLFWTLAQLDQEIKDRNDEERKAIRPIIGRMSLFFKDAVNYSSDTSDEEDDPPESEEDAKWRQYQASIVI
jgi:hypothetical protein